MITVLAGGTGSIKMVRGLMRSEEELTIISNVGDNVWLHDLYICPDIDTIVYGLAGMLDEQRGWGINGDSFGCLSQLGKLGEPSWFALGDRDIATHMIRTSMMKAGKRLSEVTNSMRDRYSLSAKIIPATDDELATIVRTGSGEMHLQEFWVKHKGKPRVTGIRYEGADKAVANPDAIRAIRRSKAVVVAPANPVSSIAPIVALSDLREELAHHRKKIMAVSPLIGDQAVSGPAVKYMKALGIRNSAVGVANYYSDFVGTFLISEKDHSLARQIESLGMRVFETNIMMKNRQDEFRLARYILRMIGK